MKLICYSGPKDGAEVELADSVKVYAIQASQFKPKLMDIYVWHESPKVKPRLVYAGQEEWEAPDASGH